MHPYCQSAQRQLPAEILLGFQKRRSGRDGMALADEGTHMRTQTVVHGVMA
jgi:hypothetical protein